MRSEHIARACRKTLESWAKLDEAHCGKLFDEACSSVSAFADELERPRDIDRQTASHMD